MELPSAWSKSQASFLVSDLVGHSDIISDVLISDSDIFTCSFDQSIKVWDRTTMSEKKHIGGHSAKVHALEWSPLSERIFSGSADTTIRTWSLDGKERAKFSCFTPVLDVALASETEILGGLADTTIKSWDLTAATEKYALKGNTKPISCLKMHEESSKLCVSGSDHGDVKTWDLRTQNCAISIAHRPSPISSLYWTKDELFVADLDENILQYDIRTGKIAKTLDNNHGPENPCILCVSDNRMLATALSNSPIQTAEGIISVRGLGSETMEYTLSNGWAAFSSMHCKGDRIAVGTDDFTVKILRLQRNQAPSKKNKGYKKAKRSAAQQQQKREEDVEITPDASYPGIGSQEEEDAQEEEESTRLDKDEAPASNGALWGGRFSAGIDALVLKLSQSVSFDKRMALQDIRGSLAHVKMLAKQKIIPEADAQAISEGLKEISKEVEEGKFEWKEELEDVHMNIESQLIKRLGDAGARVHTGRSRNDQVNLDVRLYLREQVDILVKSVKETQCVLVTLACKHKDVIFPGLTHMQHAQPVLFAHYLLAITEMLERDAGRLVDCKNRFNLCPLGSGALAGSTLPLDRELVAAELGFPGVTQNSMDTVADRDFIVELLSALAMIMMHLSRSCEDIIFWVSQEAGWVSLGDAFCTGSSLMPQKKNPDVAELIRGKTGRVYGALMSLLTTLKGIPMTYDRDEQEDKEQLFDALDTVHLVLGCYGGMMASLEPHTEVMLKAASEPGLMATDLAEHLVKLGLPFRTAHHRVGALVAYCAKNGKNMAELPLSEMQQVIPEADEEATKLWNCTASVNKRQTIGGTAPSQVHRQLETWRTRLGLQ